MKLIRHERRLKGLEIHGCVFLNGNSPLGDVYETLRDGELTSFRYSFMFHFFCNGFHQVNFVIGMYWCTCWHISMKLRNPRWWIWWMVTLYIVWEMKPHVMAPNFAAKPKRCASLAPFNGFPPKPLFYVSEIDSGHSIVTQLGSWGGSLNFRSVKSRLISTSVTKIKLSIFPSRFQSPVSNLRSPSKSTAPSPVT